MQTKEKLKRMWEKFIFDGNLDDQLTDVVRDSWIRSRLYGVDPLIQAGNKKSSRTFSRKQHELVELAFPLMKGLYSIVKGSGFLVILCDDTGRLIKIIGDDDLMMEAESIHFVEGADWSEQGVGTNAIGTCLAEGKPLQIFAHEHYAKICQNWTCSASPIRGADGEVIGVLNMSGAYENVHPHTLGMVVSAVQALEYQIRLKEKTEKHQMMQRYLEATTNTLTEGMMILDERGIVMKTNDRLKKMLRMSDDSLNGRTLDQLFGNKIWQNESHLSLHNREVRLHIRQHNQTLHVLVNKTPVYNEGTMIGSMVTMKEIQKVRQFINHLSGNQAKVTFSEMIGNHPIFVQKIKDARIAANTDSNVLLLGESGTGKDMFAQAIHNESERSANPFIAINCGGIPRDLLGSELFGYDEGAFTGARRGGSAGKFELADGGTLFLDEIGEMSLEMQVLLLRVLQDKEVMRIGGHKIIPVDVRIIAATNKDLKKEVQKGSFREDLYFRLNVMPINIPSLRDRLDDIPLLVRHFVKGLSGKLGKDVPSIATDFFGPLVNHSWPGNIRELQNVIERTMNQTQTNVLTAEDLPEELRKESIPDLQLHRLPKKEELKRQALLHSLQITNGNFSKAAKYLGVSRSTIYRQMKRYGIQES